MAVILVTGGARSGKSAYAETRVLASGEAPIYIATAEAYDDEMRARIKAHQDRRGPEWSDIHAPLDLVAALRQSNGSGVRLVDCLTLWVTNLLLAERDVTAEVDALVAELELQTSPVILVTGEVGMGIVPENKLARAFRDHAGACNQRIAAAADEVQVTISGLPLRLK
ncbi:MAG: bifunctional adenosylcobinamide kinase/adenosylcobinamide-phosphate guanylyltransferase [Halocynthiibacter sp.]